MKVGSDVIIDSFVKIKHEEHVEIGNHCSIDFGFYCTTKLLIGDYVHISPYVTCVGGVDGKLILRGGNNIMAGAKIICGSDRFDDSGLFGAMIPEELKGKQIIGDVILDEFSNVGTNSIVLPNSRLRKGVLLTAGSLLIGDTVEYGVYKGNPAKLVKIVKSDKIIENAMKLGYEL